MLETIERLWRTLWHLKKEQLSAAEKAEIMGEGFSLAHQQEAQERYEKTDDWAEYQRRTASMDRVDWQNGKQQIDEVEQSPRRGVQPRACSRAARRRMRSPNGTAPPCSSLRSPPAKHAILARGYVEDARFKAYYEKLVTGLAEWLREVIYENARARC